jgi:hypothetical protein
MSRYSHPFRNHSSQLPLRPLPLPRFFPTYPPCLIQEVSPKTQLPDYSVEAERRITEKEGSMPVEILPELALCSRHGSKNSGETWPNNSEPSE